MSFKKEKERAERGITEVGERVWEAGKLKPEEEEAYLGALRGIPELQAVARYLAGMGAAPTGYAPAEAQYQRGGPLAQQYYQQTLAGAEDPYAAYESQLQPSLQQAQDFINRQAQRRGLLRSGIPIEQMGRAGVELSIKEAQERMRFREQELGRAGQLTQYTQAGAGERLTGLAQLYGQQQQFGLAGMQRQLGAAGQAAEYQAYPYQAQLGGAYGKEAALWALPGQALGAYGGAGAPAWQPTQPKQQDKRTWV